MKHIKINSFIVSFDRFHDAKLANHAAKNWSKTGSVVDLSSPVRQRKLMALVDSGEVWGVGGRIAKRPRTMGINNVLELAC